MRVTINARHLTTPYTGIGAYCLNLLRELAEIDKESTYFVVVPRPVDFTFGPNFEIQVIEEPNLWHPGLSKLVWEQSTIPRVAKRNNSDLIHLTYPCHPNNTYGIPTILTIHDVIPWIHPEYRRKLSTKLYQGFVKSTSRKATHIIAVSQTTKHAIMNELGMDPSMVSTIYNAPPQEYGQQVTEQDKQAVLEKYNLKRPYILYVGGYDVRKNVSKLIQAFIEYTSEHGEINLVLTGDRSYHSELYENPAEYANMHVQIIHTGYIPNPELNILMQNAITLINLSTHEGFNIPLTEAIACSCPVICNNNALNREILGEAAIFVDHDNRETVMKAFNHVQTPSIREKLIKQGQEMRKNYSWNFSAQKLYNIYKKFSGEDKDRVIQPLQISTKRQTP